MVKFYSLSPALLSRVDRLSGCQGRWIVDCREIEDSYSYALRSLSDHWLIDTEAGQRYWHSLPEVPNLFKLNSLEDALQYCAATKWKSKLLFSSQYLDADCSWPGGYEASAIYRSNNRVFRDEFSKELENADGDADGLSLDIRYVTEEMLETIESLESYPLISEDDHSQLEMEDQEEAWENWAEREFSQALENRLSTILQSSLHYTDADEKGEQIVESISCLSSAFHTLADAANEYWREETGCGQWIDIERVLNNCSDNVVLSAVLEYCSDHAAILSGFIVENAE